MERGEMEQEREGEKEQGRGRRGGQYIYTTVYVTDRCCSVSSMQRRDENLYRWCDSEGWPVSSRRCTSGQQTHAVTFHRHTKRELAAVKEELLLLLTYWAARSLCSASITPGTTQE